MFLQDVLGMSEWPSGVIVDPHTMEQVIETLAIEMENIGNEKGKHCQYRWKTLSMEKAMTWDSYHIHQYQQSDQTLRVQG